MAMLAPTPAALAGRDLLSIDQLGRAAVFRTGCCPAAPWP
jgi:hypothetical protein